MKYNICWLRRDLRLEDNTALEAAMKSGNKILLLFIFDKNICDELDVNDSRINFIYKSLKGMDSRLKSMDCSGLLIKKGKPLEVLEELFQTYDIENLFFNEDFEPYGLERDSKAGDLAASYGINIQKFTDHVIFRPGTVLKADGSPYTIFTPFKKRWLQHFESHEIKPEQALLFDKFRHEIQTTFPSLEELDFEASNIQVPDFAPENIVDYEETRDYPGLDKTTKIGPHLRFGTISIRKLIRERGKESEIYTSELIWREFFIQILYLFPKVVKDSFKSKYDRITWRNNSQDFDRWCKGETGIPLVDAGMRELNQTGFMHNRVRMICASFLCKNLLIDWRLGEAYFASKLLDFELASNNGNWQWSAGTGCDSAPYFRVFNPETQQKRFDADQKYIRRWIADLDELTYPKPMVDLKASRVRAIDTYKSSINS